MLNRNLLCILFVLSVCLVEAQAQTAEEIITKSIEAHGGENALKAINTVKILGEFEAPSDGLVAPFTIYRKRPAKFRVEIVFQGEEIVQATDGEVAWDINPLAGYTEPKVMDDEHASDFFRTIDFDGLGQLLRWKERGGIADFAGVVVEDGTKLLHVKLTENDGKICNFFFDEETHMVSKFTRVHLEHGQEVERVSILSDYREINGVKMACNIEMQSGGNTLMITRYKKLEVNSADIDDTIFVMHETK